MKNSVLIVDNVAESQESTSSLLEAEGYDVSSATATEHSGDGKGFMGSYKGPKGMALAPYRHLMKN